MRNDIFQLSNIAPATVYSWTVGTAHFCALALPIKKGGVHGVYQQPYGDASASSCGSALPARAWAAKRPAVENLAAGLAALFSPRASLSVDRGDGCHFTCLRYPCARLTQESSAI